MEISPLHSQIKAADLPLDKLAGNTQISESEKIKEVGHQFEAVLLRQILSSAQKTVFPSTMNPESSSSGIYRDMMTNHLAECITHAGGLGLGNSLSAQLDRQLNTSKPTPDTAP